MIENDTYNISFDNFQVNTINQLFAFVINQKPKRKERSKEIKEVNKERKRRKEEEERRRRIRNRKKEREEIEQKKKKNNKHTVACLIETIFQNHQKIIKNQIKNTSLTTKTKKKREEKRRENEKFK